MTNQKKFYENLATHADRWRIPLSPNAIELMWQHLTQLTQINQQVNLTRITEPAQAAIHHYADSLSLAAWAADQNIAINKVADIGTGGGFPAIPLSCAMPNWHIDALDGTAKKIHCVAQFIETLGLKNIQAIHARAEQWAPPVLPDIICFRAVKNISQCLSYAQNLTKPGNYIVIYKTLSLAKDEIAEANRLASKLKLRKQPLWQYELISRDEHIQRQLVTYQAT